MMTFASANALFDSPAAELWRSAGPNIEARMPRANRRVDLITANVVPLAMLGVAVWIHVWAGQSDEGHAVWRPVGHGSAFAGLAWMFTIFVSGSTALVLRRRAPPAALTGRWALVWTLAAAGRDEDALEASEPALAMSGRGVRTLCEMAASHARLGNRDAADLEVESRYPLA